MEKLDRKKSSKVIAGATCVYISILWFKKYLFCY